MEGRKRIKPGATAAIARCVNLVPWQIDLLQCIERQDVKAEFDDIIGQEKW